MWFVYILIGGFVGGFVVALGVTFKLISFEGEERKRKIGCGVGIVAGLVFYFLG